MDNDHIEEISKLIDYLQETRKFINWIEDKAVYRFDIRSGWVLLTFKNVEMSLVDIGLKTYGIPETKFSILAAENPFITSALECFTIPHTDRSALKKLDPKEYPLYLKNTTTWFEQMIKAGKWTPKQLSENT